MDTEYNHEAKIAEFPKDCPRCHNTIKAFEYMALSRRDNDTEICHSCGELEAWEDARMAFPFAGEPYWSEVKYERYS